MATNDKSLYGARKELRKIRRAQRKELMKKQDEEFWQAYEEAEADNKKLAEESLRNELERKIKRIKKRYPNADLTEIYEQLKPEYNTDDVIIDDISTDVDMLPSDEEIQAIQNEAKNEKEISLQEFSIDDIKGIKSFEEMQKIDPKISERDYQHALNAWYIAQKVGERIGVDPRLIFGQFGVETLFRDGSVLEQYNYGNVKNFDKYGKNVPQYEGQKSYRDNLIRDNVDYYKRFNTIDEAIEWYAQRYAEDGGSVHSLKGDAKKDALAFSKSLFASGYYEGDPEMPEPQRPYVYQRGIVSQANKWLSSNALTAQQYSEDPYYIDFQAEPVTPIEERQGLSRLDYKIIPGIQASEKTRPSGIASLDAINKSATEKQKIASADLTAKEEARKKIDGLDKATKGANAINAVNAAVGLGLGIYGASQINKMQRPSMISAPQIEAVKIRDTGAQAMSARKGMIEQSANTSREALRRAGRSDLNATITAGETRALNEAAGAIEGMRANINASNVAAENRVREINASTKMQADQFNSQIQSAFNQFKSQLGSQNLSTTVQNISGNLGGIAQNNYARALRKEDQAIQERQFRMGLYS